MAVKRVGIVMGSGPVPGLNSVIKFAVDHGNQFEWEEDPAGAARRSS